MRNTGTEHVDFVPGSFSSNCSKQAGLGTASCPRSKAGILYLAEVLGSGVRLHIQGNVSIEVDMKRPCSIVHSPLERYGDARKDA